MNKIGNYCFALKQQEHLHPKDRNLTVQAGCLREISDMLRHFCAHRKNEKNKRILLHTTIKNDKRMRVRKTLAMTNHGFISVER